MPSAFGNRIRAVRWPLAILAASLVPVSGLFTTSRIFFVRDLSFFFWSRHLWLRHTIFEGQAPWWDPFVAGGQSAIADALNQLLMPVTLAIRLLPSDVVAFNLWVALPLPVAAFGTFLFLRRRTGDPGAALGACVFSASGPIVSMLSMPNLAWSVALLPWVLRSVDDVVVSPEPLRGQAGLAGAFALQALCGEPVTWATTGLLAAASSLVRISPSAPRRPVRVVAGLSAGALLAAAQLVPTLAAGVRAHRAALATPDFWSLHPLALWETLAPHLFGNYYDAFLGDLPWVGALNFGRDPFFYSLYLGPLVVLLAAAGAACAIRRNGFWVAVALIAILAALGGYTPMYPLLRKLLPPLMYLRFPVKYLVFAVFACAVLAAEGWRFVSMPRNPVARETPLGWVSGVGGVAALGLLTSLGLLALPGVVSSGSHWLAVSTHLKDPAAGASFLARLAPPLAARGFGLLLAGAVLIQAARHRRAVLSLLFVATCADTAITNANLNPTMPLSKLEPPAWYSASAGPQRLYIGGRVRGFMNVNDPDAAPAWQIPAESTAIEGRMELNAQLPMAPSGWRVREALSYDLPYLWPAAYEAVVRRFERAAPDERTAFLRRSGVRRCVLPQTERRPFPAIVDVPDWNMRVFECDPRAMRAFVASTVEVAAEGADAGWQREALFDTGLRDDVARIPARPAPAGRAGAVASGPPSVRILEDRGTTVVLEAALSGPGLVVLRDSYDPSWHADADGMPAEIVPANALYRAVALGPGRHVIRFSYRPRDFIAGLIISAMAAAALTFIAASGRRRTLRRAQAGFTLIELMIVLAIMGVLLAMAFTEYRGMRARGNDASAIASLRSIAAAQWQFALTCGNMKYASTLTALGQPVPATGQAFLSPDLSSADSLEKAGYVFQMAAKPLESAPPACNGAAVADGYAATADPARPGASGGFFYGVNADRILYVDQEKTYTGNLPESGAPAHGIEVK